MPKVAGRNGGELTTPEKGEIRNPKGRGKGHPNRATVAKRWLDILTKTKNPITGVDEPGTIEDKVMLSLIQKALKGDAKAIELVFEMKYGKMMQPMDISVETPRTVEWIRTDKQITDVAHSEQEIKDREGL